MFRHIITALSTAFKRQPKNLDSGISPVAIVKGAPKAHYPRIKKELRRYRMERKKKMRQQRESRRRNRVA